jgi:3-oxoacyl-[acyl-carrier protein] reductase
MTYLKTALVTGASSGIGRAIALSLAGKGVNIALHYLAAQAIDDPEYRALHAVPGMEAAAQLRRQIEDMAVRVAVVEGDLMKEGSAQAILDAAEAELGSIDILVNNAAHCEAADTVLGMSYPKLVRSIMVNDVSATMLISEFARRHKKAGKAKGRIVNISTDSAQKFPGQIGYGASKAYMEAITRSAAIELGPLGITVNSIAPGPVQTGWMDPEHERRVLNEIPVGRVGRPEDIAGTVLFLVSEQADWITGQIIKVSGGHAL